MFVLARRSFSNTILGILAFLTVLNSTLIAEDLNFKIKLASSTTGSIVASVGPLSTIVLVEIPDISRKIIGFANWREGKLYVLLSQPLFKKFLIFIRKTVTNRDFLLRDP